DDKGQGANEHEQSLHGSLLSDIIGRHEGRFAVRRDHSAAAAVSVAIHRSSFPEAAMTPPRRCACAADVTHTPGLRTGRWCPGPQRSFAAEARGARGV